MMTVMKCCVIYSNNPSKNVLPIASKAFLEKFLQLYSTVVDLQGTVPGVGLMMVVMRRRG